MTRLEQYNEGLKFLHQALDALDQADACMRDVHMNYQLQAAAGYHKPTLKQMSTDLISLCQEAEWWECEDCGKPITDHEETGDCAWWNGSIYEAKGRARTQRNAEWAIASAKRLTPPNLRACFKATIDEFDGGYDWDWQMDRSINWDGAKVREAEAR